MTETAIDDLALTPAVGEIHGVAGPVVVAKGLPATRLYNVVQVGHARLPGEVIRLDGADVVIQVYEDTSGLAAGEPVTDTREPLQVELGPGLLGSIFDGTQRPLTVLARAGENPWGTPMIPRGVSAPALDRERTWEFQLAVAVAERVDAGDVLGTVQETVALAHRILVPPGLAGTVTDVRGGRARIDDPVVWIDGNPLTMLSRWPAAVPRRFRAASAPARRCSSSRSRSGGTPTSSSTSRAASVATS